MQGNENSKHINRKDQESGGYLKLQVHMSHIIKQNSNG